MLTLPFSVGVKLPVSRIIRTITQKRYKTNMYSLYEESLEINRNAPFASENDLKECMLMFPTVVKDLLEDVPEVPESKEHFKNLYYYNVPNIKLAGSLLLSAYKELEKPENLTEENLKLTEILAWCTEMLQSSIAIHDDIVNSSEMRNGVKCWYKKDYISMRAIEDGRTVTKAIYLLLKKYFHGHGYYVQLLKLFQEMETLTRMGCALDGVLVSNKLEFFNMENYYKLTKYKTCNLFALPIIAALYLSDKNNKDVCEEAKLICHELGNYHQINNDFKNYSDGTVVGNDIRQGKFTWIAAVALQTGTVKQREILEKHYGQNNEESEMMVMNLYNQLCLSEEYKTLKNSSYGCVVNLIERLSPPSLQKVFSEIVQELYK